MSLNEAYIEIIGKYTEDDIFEEVQQLKSEYVSDWEDEFDSLDEAYEEQGRGEAEIAAIHSIMSDFTALSDEEKGILFDELVEYYGLSVD